MQLTVNSKAEKKRCTTKAFNCPEKSGNELVSCLDEGASEFQFREDIDLY